MGEKKKTAAKYATNAARALVNKQIKWSRVVKKLERLRLRQISRFNAGKTRSHMVTTKKKNKTVTTVETRKTKAGEPIRQGFAADSPRDVALQAHIAAIMALTPKGKRG